MHTEILWETRITFKYTLDMLLSENLFIADIVVVTEIKTVLCISAPTVRVVSAILLPLCRNNRFLSGTSTTSPRDLKSSPPPERRIRHHLFASIYIVLLPAAYEVQWEVTFSVYLFLPPPLPPGQLCSADGMPLAFTQEDFLISFLISSKRIDA